VAAAEGVTSVTYTASEVGVVAATVDVTEGLFVFATPVFEVSFGGATHPAKMRDAIMKRLRKIDPVFIIVHD